MTQTGIGFAIGFLSACNALWDRVAVRFEINSHNLRRGTRIIALAASAIFLAEWMMEPASVHDAGPAQVGDAQSALAADSAHSDFVSAASPLTFVAFAPIAAPVAAPVATPILASNAASHWRTVAQPFGLTAVLAFLLLQLADARAEPRNRRLPANQPSVRAASSPAAEHPDHQPAGSHGPLTPRERELERHIVELQDWRMRLERQSQKLAEIADQSLREKAIIDREAQQRARILAAMSHELNTPLNAIIGFSDIMRREVLGPMGHARYQDYAGHINDSGQALLSAIRSILQLIEGDRLTALLAEDETACLASIVEGAHRAMADCQADTVIEVQAICCQSRVVGDSAALRQAIIGLMSATAHRLPEANRLQVTTRLSDGGIEILFGTSSTNELHLQTALPRHKLEIALARSIFEVYGGSIEVRDDPARWMVRASLPLATPPFPGAYSTAGMQMDIAAPAMPILATPRAGQS